MDGSRTTRVERIAMASVAVALAVLGLKAGAWWLTGSVALFADAPDSVVNVAAAVAALVAIRLSALPPDANHPDGHATADCVPAVLEGALILTAAVLILVEALGRLPRPPRAGAAGRGARDLRPHRGRAEGRARHRRHHHPCGARGQCQAPGRAGAVKHRGVLVL